VNNYFTLGSGRQRGDVENSEEQEIVVQDVTGLENLVVRFQGEYAYNVGLKGFQWDVTNGGANPTSTNVGLGTNWDTILSSSQGPRRRFGRWFVMDGEREISGPHTKEEAERLAA
jgi:hypothetical protein